MNDVLISIRPQHVEKILLGEKQVEIRRRRLSIHPGDRLWIYSTLPTARVEAVATVVAIEQGALQDLWNRIASVSGTTYENLVAYCDGSDVIFALWLAEVIRLERAPDLATLRREIPGFSPPQFFAWMPVGSALHNFLVDRLNGNESSPSHHREAGLLRRSS